MYKQLLYVPRVRLVIRASNVFANPMVLVRLAMPVEAQLAQIIVGMLVTYNQLLNAPRGRPVIRVFNAFARLMEVVHLAINAEALQGQIIVIILVMYKQLLSALRISTVILQTNASVAPDQLMGPVPCGGVVMPLVILLRQNHVHSQRPHNAEDNQL
jgi:hypothetical protein